MIIVSTKKLPPGQQHSHAHFLLAQCLKEYGVDYICDVTPLNYGSHGKPFLANRPDLHFNISHADGIAAAMVSDFECGIDCERIRPFKPRVMLRAYSKDEQTAVNSAPQNQRDFLFFRLWTLKEAYIKAIGTGLSYPMKNAAFAFEDGKIFTDLQNCRFSQFLVGGEFLVAVCEIN